MSDVMYAMPPFDWQQTQWDNFCQRVHANTLAHAYLLSGSQGIGAQELALAMGQYLLCSSPLANIACGNCRSCALLRANTHPDFLWVHPEEKGKQIKVDQVREISLRVSQTAQQGGKKVIVVSPAEAMNINAANAILKNLEEPSGETFFFLVSYQANRVLPTIRSRCAKVTLALPSYRQSLAWLQEVGVESPEQILDDASGAPLLAKEWRDQGLAQQLQDIMQAMVDVGEGRLEPMGFAKRFAKSDPFVIIQQMLTAVERVIGLQVGGREVSEHYRPLLSICHTCRTDILFRLRDRLCERKSQLLSSPNLNAALLVEELALDWAAMLGSCR